MALYQNDLIKTHKLLSMPQLGTCENNLKIRTNYTKKGNKDRSLNKMKAKKSTNFLIYIII